MMNFVDYYPKRWREEYSINGSFLLSVTPGFDNSLQRRRVGPDGTVVLKSGGKVITSPTPAQFKQLLQTAKRFSEGNDLENKLIVIKARNEWPESSVLAPTKRWGFGYLEAIREVLRPNRVIERPRATSERRFPGTNAQVVHA